VHNSTAYLHCALAAAQCTVVGPVCLFVAGWVGVCVSSSSSYLFAQNSTRHLKQSQADNELDGQGSNGALTAT